MTTERPQIPLFDTESFRSRPSKRRLLHQNFLAEQLCRFRKFPKSTKIDFSNSNRAWERKVTLDSSSTMNDVQVKFIQDRVIIDGTRSSRLECFHGLCKPKTPHRWCKEVKIPVDVSDVRVTLADDSKTSHVEGKKVIGLEKIEEELTDF